MSVIATDEANFHYASVIKPNYQYTKQVPQEPAGNFNVTSAQGLVTTFQLIPNVMNLSENELCFTAFVPAQGANNFTFMNINGLKFFDRITTQAQGGPFLMDLNQVDHYLDITARRSFSHNDVSTWDLGTDYGAPNAGTSFFEGLSSTNYTNANTTRLDGTTTAKDGESAYVCVSAVNSPIYLDVKIKLNKLTDTILGLNRDLYWRGANFTITIWWKPLQYWAWIGTNAAQPQTGTAPCASPNAGGLYAQIISPYMNVAIEKNPDICKTIIDRTMSSAGLTFKLPYVWEWGQAINSTQNNFSSYYNDGQGSHIKKIWWAVYTNAPPTPNLTYDKSNLANAKVLQFQTQIDGIFIQQSAFLPAQADDFMFLRDQLRGSDILSFNEHLYNWCWCDDFTYEKNKFLKSNLTNLPDDNLIKGLPLIKGKNMQYNVQATTTGNLFNYTFTVFLRECRIADVITVV